LTRKEAAMIQVGSAQRLGSLPWWLQALYAVLAVSMLALGALVVGEVVDAFKSNGVEDDTHHHASYDRIFDIAWLVFVPSFVIVLVAGAIGLIAGKLRRRRALTAYGARAVAYCAAAVVIVVLAEVLGS
jgi:hypothetical protein